MERRLEALELQFGNAMTRASHALLEVRKLQDDFEARFPVPENCPHCGRMVSKGDKDRGSCGLCGKGL
jgi:hypothetical protein